MKKLKLQVCERSMYQVWNESKDHIGRRALMNQIWCEIRNKVRDNLVRNQIWRKYADSKKRG